MRMRSCVIFSCTLAGLLALASLEGLPFVRPGPVHAQADSARSDRDVAPPSSPQTKKATAGVGQLFQQHCVKCHGKDGTGGPARNSMPDIPDFTDASWQAQRTDAQLLASILEGKGDDMPAFARKIKEDQARDLVSHIRAFAPTKGKSKKEKQDKPDSSDFEDRFGRLQKEMDQLRRQSRELSQSARPKPSKPSEFSPEKADEPSVPKVEETSAVTELFQKHCVKCHGADGTGSQARDRLPEIPDFTSQTWQEKRSDAQLQAAILDGKGTFMPPFSNKLDNEKVKCLTELVRAYAAKSAENFSEQTTSPQTAAVVSFGSRGSAKSVRGIPTTIQRLIPSGVKLMIIVMIGRYRT